MKKVLPLCVVARGLLKAFTTNGRRNFLRLANVSCLGIRPVRRRHPRSKNYGQRRAIETELEPKKQEPVFPKIEQRLHRFIDNPTSDDDKKFLCKLRKFMT